MPFPLVFLSYRKADRIMLGLIWLMFFFALLLAYLHDTFIQVGVVGGCTSLLLTVLYRAIGGTRLMRCFLAFGLMVMAALHINQAEGVIESHFGIFALLAVLMFYRDWLPNYIPISNLRVRIDRDGTDDAPLRNGKYGELRNTQAKPPNRTHRRHRFP